MSTDPAQDQARLSPAAERMRAYRKRRREAMRYVRIPLHVTEVDALIRIGRLKEDSRTDAEVVLSLLYQALGESEIGTKRVRSKLSPGWKVIRGSDCAKDRYT